MTTRLVSNTATVVVTRHTNSQKFIVTVTSPVVKFVTVASPTTMTV